MSRAFRGLVGDTLFGKHRVNHDSPAMQHVRQGRVTLKNKSVPFSPYMRTINLGPWFFIAGVIGMSTMVSTSGLGDLIGRALFSMIRLTPGNDAGNFAALSAIGMGVGMVTTIPGQPAIMATLAAPISLATGCPW